MKSGQDEFFDDGIAYERFRSVREEVVDDRLFIVDQEESAIHMLEPVGAAVWRLLEQPQRVADVSGILSSAFPDADAETIADDIEDLFIELESYKLIRPAK